MDNNALAKSPGPKCLPGRLSNVLANALAALEVIPSNFVQSTVATPTTFAPAPPP
eukprot:CAMPEP_0177407784 /NCGR_PEP_ID=MMETSP0368-20130122/63305_1 /TAXON_ID=447022 ORGANISM="Scrippsiella hangoei-like, Strain SHHI-4" /NCGR_SAMPLE_ID=MMETSP0368 /ASSEMBLY_ACC=CAM_ASM_000363 /LENGTH=54 /DNA_ID=CAMNT_0018876329 /DNA_START=403 /DNA_END=563 /DNA_ORIENTATION=-